MLLSKVDCGTYFTVVLLHGVAILTVLLSLSPARSPTRTMDPFPAPLDDGKSVARGSWLQHGNGCDSYD